MTHLHHRKYAISLYGIVVFLYWMSQYLYMPTLPVYVHSKTENLAMVGVVLAMFGLWQGIIRLPLGIVADWVGWRKPFIMVCLALGAVGSWILGTSETLTGLIVGRALTGLAAGSWVLLIVSFNSLFSQQEVIRATTLITLVSLISRWLSTSVTGFLNTWGGYVLAFFLAALVTVLALLLMIPAPETRRSPKRPSLQSLLTLVTRKDVLLPSLLSMIVLYVVWGLSYGFFLLLAKQLGASEVTLSALVSMSVVIVIVGNLAATTIAPKVGIRRMVMLSFVIQSVGIGLTALAPSLPVVFVAQFLVGYTFGVTYPLLMGLSIQYVAEHERATAMGLHQAVYSIGMFGGPWLSGLLADSIDMGPMFGITAIFTGVLGVSGTYCLPASPNDSVST